jgi:hypothetical protein
MKTNRASSLSLSTTTSTSSTTSLYDEKHEALSFEMNGNDINHDGEGDSDCDCDRDRKPPAKKSRLEDHPPPQQQHQQQQYNRLDGRRSNSNSNRNNHTNINHYQPQQQKHQYQYQYHVKPLTAKPLFRTMDEVHRSISLPEPIIRLFLDSKYFQRLGRIKQLGTANLIYRSATHTRLEHSIGTAKLARRLVETIADQQPNLLTTKTDIVCIALAGLLHDVGHGPFSHIFEGKYIDVCLLACLFVRSFVRLVVHLFVVGDVIVFVCVCYFD